MVDRPTRRRIGRFGNALLSGNEDPAQGSARPHLFSVEHFRMLGDEGLQFFLFREAFFFEWFKLSLLDPGCRCALSSRSASLQHPTLRATIRTSKNWINPAPINTAPA